MYQSEMNRLEKAGLVQNGKPAELTKTDERSWGRRYVEDYATALQLIVGLLAGLAMLINAFLRLHAEEPEPSSVRENFPAQTPTPRRAQAPADEFPNQLDVSARTPARRPELAPKMTTPDDIVDDTHSQQKTTPAAKHPGLARLRETLRLIAFASGPCHYKVDLKDKYIIIRRMVSRRGDVATTHSVRAKLTLLDAALSMEPGAFRTKLERFLRENNFEI